LYFHGASGMVSATEDEKGVHVVVEHHPTKATETLDCDAVVYATGFAPMARAPARVGDVV